MLKIVQRHIDERGLVNASQFGFRTRLTHTHTHTLQCMRLTDHVTLNFNNTISTAAVFLDIERAFDATWHIGLLHKLSKLKFPISLVKLIIIALFFLRENSEPRSKVKYLRQGIYTYKQGCHNVPSCPLHCTVLPRDGVTIDGI
jgi:hypothetical protein